MQKIKDYKKQPLVLKYQQPGDDNKQNELLSTKASSQKSIKNVNNF